MGAFEELLDELVAAREQHHMKKARRARGELANDDGPRLALLGADLEALAGLRAEAEAGVAAVWARLETERVHEGG